MCGGFGELSVGFRARPSWWLSQSTSVGTPGPQWGTLHGQKLQEGFP